jgi:hypothetical protein
MQRRKQRKGKAKPRRKMRQGSYELDALPRTGRAQIKTLGSAQAIPPFRFFRSEYKFQQIVDLSAFAVHTGNTGDTITSGAGVTAGSMAWSLNDVSQAATFQALFDQYRITKIDLHICWFSGSAIAGPNLYVVEDWDNATALASKVAAQSYQSCQEIRPGDSIVIRLQPCAAVATAAGSELRPSPWLDINTATNQHFGVKWVIGAGAGNTWIVNAQYTFECYTVR